MVSIPLKKLFSLRRMESCSKSICDLRWTLRVEDGGRWPVEGGKGRRLGLFLRCQGPAGPGKMWYRRRVVAAHFKIHKWLGNNKPALVQKADEGEMEFARPYNATHM